MSVNNGDIANAQTFNDAFVSKKVDSTVDAKINLNDTGSSPVPDVQNKINTMDSDITQNKNDIAQNQFDISTNQTNISNNQTEISNIRSTTGTSSGDVDMGTYTGSIISDNGSVKQNIQELETQVETNKNDIATLQNQPVFTFLGSWDASTNTPTLVDGTGSTGDAYKVSVAGTQDFGSGPISFIVGDLVFYDGSRWDKDKEQVSSVFGRQGAIVAQSGDYTWNQIDKTVSSIDDISDVDTSTTPPSNNDKLKWNGSSWVPGKDSIDELTDVDTSTTPPNIGEGLKWDGTNWVPGKVASSGGSGFKNYVKNSEILDLQNITATSNITLAQETTNYIRGLESLKATISSVSTTSDYFEFSLDSIDNIDYENSVDIWISFEYYTDANYSDDDIEVVLWDVTNSNELFVFGTNGGLIPSSSSKTKFLGRAALDYTSNSYTLRFKVKNAPATNSNIYLDSISVSPVSFYNSLNEGSKIKYKSNNGQSIPNATQTKINFNTIVYDDDALVTNPSTNWVFTANRDGYYKLSAMITFAPHSSSEGVEYKLTVMKNGILTGDIFTNQYRQSLSSIYFSINGSTELKLNKGDTIEIAAYQATGASINLHNSNDYNFVVIEESPSSYGLISTTESMFENSHTNASISAASVTFSSTGAYSKIPIDSLASSSGVSLEFRQATNDILVKENGNYRITTQVSCSIPSTSGTRRSAIAVNGIRKNISSFTKNTNGITEEITLNNNEILYLKKGDVVSFEFLNTDLNDSINGQENSSFAITKLNNLYVYSVYNETKWLETNPSLFDIASFTDTNERIVIGSDLVLGTGEWDIFCTGELSLHNSTSSQGTLIYIRQVSLNNDITRPRFLFNSTNSLIHFSFSAQGNLVLSSQDTVRIYVRKYSGVSDNTHYLDRIKLSARKVK